MSKINVRLKKREIKMKNILKIKKPGYVLKVCVLTGTLMCFVLLVYTLLYNTAVETRIKSGSESDRVMLVQQKLKELGLYNGECDGIYDVDTADAVRRFQKYNGLEADGVCNNETLNLLGLNLYTYSEFELDVLAKLIESEAGGYDLQTMTAVGAVVMNRVKNGAFPDSVLQVVYSGGSFDSIVNGKINNTKPSELAYRAAQDALMGFDPTDEALYVLHGGSYGKIITMQSGDIYFGK